MLGGSMRVRVPLSASRHRTAVQSFRAGSSVSLSDKYDISVPRIYLTGVQALVRLPLIRKELDISAGQPNTAGFITGYQGSPLGTYDQHLRQAKNFLTAADIHFSAGLNEDTAATAVWGTQAVGRHTNIEANYGNWNKDGVFSIWYGKGPGVDRSCDVFKHANLAGTAPLGGVLAVFGDDHGCKSSTLPHQSEFALVGCSMPILYPAGVQETMDYGILGLEQSRYAGVWVGLKTTSDTMDASESVLCPLHRGLKPSSPPGYNDVHLRAGEFKMVAAEERLLQVKLPLAQDWWFHNAIDRVCMGVRPDEGDAQGPKPIKLGVLTAGKPFLDVKKALKRVLGVGGDELDQAMADAGISVFKVGMVWPLEPRRVTAWATACEHVLVVEEKKALLETQLRDLLYHNPDRPGSVVGKRDVDATTTLLRATMQLSPHDVATALQRRLSALGMMPANAANASSVADNGANTPGVPYARTPYFCAGCPHNTSTTLPRGSKAMAGIGCHTMAMFMDGRPTLPFTQMGGEGCHWIGMHQFSDPPEGLPAHVFANMGDGTYVHSGLLAIRASLAATPTPNITYKILYNDAVAMTGGQEHPGAFSVAGITSQLLSEGVGKVYVVTDEPEKFGSNAPLDSRVQISHRTNLDQVQRSLRDTPGVTALVYDQTCAAEKRRRRKKGKFPNPAKRVVIHPRVCEGCGDCGLASNCVAVKPLDTEYGRKRRIDQSACNKDFSCLDGHCPALVTVHGEAMAANTSPAPPPPITLPDPAVVDHPRGILCTGIGGTGVVTIGALLGMAAHIDGKATVVLDEVGLAQKGGSVVTHVQVGPDAEEGSMASRLQEAEADLLLAFDTVTAAIPDNLQRLRAQQATVPGTFAIVNTAQTMLGQFARDPDMQFPQRQLMDAITDALGPQNEAIALDLEATAMRLLGDSIYSNLIGLGIACQHGQLPVSVTALEQAIKLNNVSVSSNLLAFQWGRAIALQPELATEDTSTDTSTTTTEVTTDAHNPTSAAAVAALVNRNAEELVLWAGDNGAVSDKYRGLVSAVLEAEGQGDADVSDFPLAHAVATNYFKLLAYKDEYEVARLHLDWSPQECLGGDASLDVTYSLGHDWLTRWVHPLIPSGYKHGKNGNSKTRVPQALARPIFSVLCMARRLRGTPLDPFRTLPDRVLDRHILSEYEADVEAVALNRARETEVKPLVLELLQMPEYVRGFGHVREKKWEKVDRRRKQLLNQLN